MDSGEIYGWQICLKCVFGMNPQKFRKRKRLKYNANLEYQAGLRSGKIIRPLACSACGVTGCQIEGHHEDYKKPLDVQWLCMKFHDKVQAGYL